MASTSNAPNQASTDPQPQELFHYLPDHQVLVCVPCQYAVQPSAISRHLKEIHLIHRARRRPFMEFVAGLSLKEPQEVLPPKAHEFPVSRLLVRQGLRWEWEGCNHLCVTTRRMKSHWVAMHGRQDKTGRDWQPVPLQSFFSGNLLRYFTRPADAVTTRGDDIEAAGVKPSRLPVNNDNCPDAIFPSVETVDTVIYQHYIASTALTIATDAETDRIWRVVIPELAKSHPFLMHGILACAAQHIAFLNPEKQQEYTVRACNHQDKAMPLFRFAIANPDKDNCNAILAFSHLLPIYSFAAQKRRNESLFLVDITGTDIIPSWLHFLRSGCCMLCSVERDLQQGPLGALLAVWEKPIDIEEGKNAAFLDSLLGVIPEPTSEYAWPNDIAEVCRHAAAELARSFLCMESLGVSLTTWDVLRIWPMRVSMEYMSLLCDKHPGALILLAHYCVLLKGVQCNWYFDGEAARLMAVIYHCLDANWHCHIRGPLEQVNT